MNETSEHDTRPETEADDSRFLSVMVPFFLRVPHQQTRNLNDVVHRILVVGLTLSTVLLLFGLILDLFSGKELPAVALSPREAIQRALVLRPSGFLSLGLMVLLVTPVVRVIGSIIVFIWERDWRFVLITVLVLLIMIASVFLGRG